MSYPHKEYHRSDRIGWLRASVLGANDGIVSTASLIVGVAAAQASRHDILIAAIAALVAGAMSMAAGEYVSVSSQKDTEEADLVREEAELSSNPQFELNELTQIYVNRGLNQNLAKEVAQELMKHNALEAHAREELGISLHNKAKPLQAALASAVMFSSGAILPIVAVLISPTEANLIVIVTIVSLVLLIGLGMMAAKAGGASPLKGGLRVFFWGAFAMGLTALVGSFFGTNP